MIFIFFVFLIFITIGGSLLEYKIYKTPFTPFMLFTVPYLTIIILQTVWIYMNDELPLSIIFLSYYFIFIVLLFIIGNSYLYLINNIVSKHNFYKKLFCNTDNLKWFKYISIISSIYLLFSFVVHASSLSLIGQAVQEDFQNKYAGGINFYLRLFSMIGSVYFFTIAKNKTDIFFGIFCLLPNFLTFVKGISIIIVLAGIVAHMTYYKKPLQIYQILKIIIFGLLLFSTIYLIEISVWNPEKLFLYDTYVIIFNKIITYLISGVQSFNINSNDIFTIYKGDNITIAPFVNVLHKVGILDYRIDTIGTIHTVIYNNPILGIIDTNINTYIGTILIYSGMQSGILIHIVIILIVYTFFYASLVGKSILHKIYYGLFVSGFALAWFEYYYMHTFWLYLILIYVFIVLLSAILKNKKKINIFY